MVPVICSDTVLKQSFKDLLFYNKLISIATSTAHPEYLGIDLDTFSALQELFDECLLGVHPNQIPVLPKVAHQVDGGFVYSRYDAYLQLQGDGRSLGVRGVQLHIEEGGGKGAEKSAKGDTGLPQGAATRVP